jgi:hypothetical protein
MMIKYEVIFYKTPKLIGEHNINSTADVLHVVAKKKYKCTPLNPSILPLQKHILWRVLVA